MYIYLTKNLVNGKIYIGQCSKESHKTQRYLGSGKILKKAVKKYGRKNFKKYILMDGINSTISLDYYEKYYIALYKSRDRSIGYNISLGGSGSNLEKQSLQSNLKRSNTLSSRKRTPEERAAISRGQRNMDPNVARGRSNKISIKLKGKRKSKEAINKNKKAYKLSGELHPHTKSIYIFNQYGEVMFISKGNFKKFCSEYGLPFSSMVRSYQSKGRRLYDNVSMCRVKEENKKFIGWYAVSQERKEK